jgi:hypothetical protein
MRNTNTKSFYALYTDFRHPGARRVKAGAITSVRFERERETAEELPDNYSPRD